MKLVTGEEMKQIDKIAIEEYGIPEIILMEAAGNAVVEEIEKFIIGCCNKSIAIVCGKGNNGGDGFVIARKLLLKGFSVKVYLLAPPESIQGAAKTNLNILKKLNCPIEIEGKNVIETLKIEAIRTGLIIDCILGTGIQGEVGPVFQEAIDIINTSAALVVSVDIPSGVIADSGHIAKAAVQADKTICLQLPKVGNINYPGADYNGELIIKDIGIPSAICNGLLIDNNLITKDMVAKILTKRKGDTHKGTYGNGLIVAGSAGMTGAAILSATAAMRMGAGIIRVAAPESVNTVLENRLTEVITVPLRETKKGYMGIDDIDKVTGLIQLSNVIAVGPGCGTTLELQNLIRNVLENSNIPVVIDADGLNVLSQKIEFLSHAKAPVILTPHPKEFSRITGLSVEEINSNRINTAREFATKHQLYLVLKGSRTVVAYPNGEIYVNCTGNPGMATAGSGDALTGIITGLLAQGLEPNKAVAAAVYIHGRAGDFAAAEKGEYSLIAGDIVEAIPSVIKELVNSPTYNKGPEKRIIK